MPRARSESLTLASGTATVFDALPLAQIFRALPPVAAESASVAPALVGFNANVSACTVVSAWAAAGARARIAPLVASASALRRRASGVRGRESETCGTPGWD